MPEPAVNDQEFWSDVQPVLDQELSRLPDKYRIAIVLCDLEGKSRKDAARHLKIPEGTLSSRLTTGRRLLARRLARHGLSVSAAALMTDSIATASLPARLIVDTVRAAVRDSRVRA